MGHCTLIIQCSFCKNKLIILKPYILKKKKVDIYLLTRCVLYLDQLSKTTKESLYTVSFKTVIILLDMLLLTSIHFNHRFIYLHIITTFIYKGTANFYLFANISFVPDCNCFMSIFQFSCLLSLLHCQFHIYILL